MSVKLSVIIAAFRPGGAFSRVVESLDAQTLPQDEFEVLVVDDGSGDDTLQLLAQVADARSNWRVVSIENSGWPSKPRNLGIQLARGEYLLFMDHDDSLYASALGDAYAYARRCAADVLSPKESKTDDPWWGLDAGLANIPDVAAAGGIKLIKPLVPHKLYRREFVLQHGLTFPEGRRMLWEDVYFNVSAYRRAATVAAQVDSPFYVWHSSSTNNSKSYGAGDREYWDRLDDLYAFLVDELPGAEHRDDRRELILTQYRNRTLRRAVQSLTMSPEQRAEGVRRAQEQAERYLEPGWEESLAPLQRTQSRLLRAGHLRALHDLDRSESSIKATVSATGVSWRDGVLHVDVEAAIGSAGGRAFTQREGRVIRRLPDDVQAVVGDYLDVTDLAGRSALRAIIRSRTGWVSWALPVEQSEAGFSEGSLWRRGVLTLDPRVVEGGHALGPSVWDAHVGLSFQGRRRSARVRVGEVNLPALVHGAGYSVYRNKKGFLSIDSAQSLRSLLMDGRPTVAGSEAKESSVRLPLANMHVAGDTQLVAGVTLRAAQAKRQRLLEFLGVRRAAAVFHVEARLVGANGQGHVVVDAPAERGTYELVDPTRKVGGTGVKVEVTDEGVRVLGGRRA